MITSLRLFSFLSLTVFSTVSFAKGENTPVATPLSIESGWNLGTVIRGPYTNSQECANKTAIRLDKGSEDYQSMKAIVLAAYTTKKRLKFYVEGCSGSFANAVWVAIVD